MHFLTNVFLLICVLLCGCTGTKNASTPTIPKGTTSSGGGNAIEMDFKIIGSTLVKTLELRATQSDLAHFEIARLKETLKMLRVIESDKDLFKDAKPVDAINYPDLNEVHLNASRWKNNLNSFQKERLVLHEIFGLMRKDDSSYQLSDAFLETLNRTTFLVFNLLQIQGPAAIELLKKVDWSGITPSPNRTDRILLTIPSSDLASVLLACSFDGNLDRTKPVSGYLDESSVVGDPVCFFGVRGVLANRQAYIEISEGREELWTRICPKGEENFDFGNIRGYKNAMGKHQLRFHIYDI